MHQNNTNAVLNKPTINEIILKLRIEQTFTVDEITDIRDIEGVGFMHDVEIQTSMMQHSVGIQVKI